MGSLCEDGGPSVTRWVFLRTAEVMSIVMLGLTGCSCFELISHHSVDNGVLTLIAILAPALFGFATLTQNTKITVDSKATASLTPVSAEIAPAPDVVKPTEENHA